ncbi:MAG TPA: HIT family protein [Candidatus Binataceae bacterium]|jgi:diadenosine tetraphosphate (Ap4A) HIT family hydrolase|nr:HIT family protein [Candidatus Binataceae bacterium]
MPDRGARPCGICALIERCRAGGFTDLIAELPQSFVILGDAQFYRGYCVVLAKRHVNEIHLMEPAQARALFDEILAVGNAIYSVTRPLKLNYECLGNLEPHVHWHVFPRYQSDALRAAPVWVRPESERKVVLDDADRRELIRALEAELRRCLAAARTSE